ncbi:putative GMP reductase 2 [Apostichopus japonicus]|uniref:GMP reductase n=1 Tax=Stichopus japonicus TaxID=307972 RepID=A0A2G8KR88_STIJA|nr:putative GMP reductase 2 [Apostichopus japonicus]
MAPQSLPALFFLIVFEQHSNISVCLYYQKEGWGKAIHSLALSSNVQTQPMVWAAILSRGSLIEVHEPRGCDGGCTCPGDVVKAFGAGADFVMLGGMLSGHDESDGEVIQKNGKNSNCSTG